MRTAAILTGALSVALVLSNGKASARNGDLTYEEQIILCSAFHIVDQYADYPVELSTIHALDFAREFDRLLPEDKEGEHAQLQEQEQIVRKLMHIFMYSNASESQKYQVAEKVYRECQSTHLALLSSRGLK